MILLISGAPAAANLTQAVGFLLHFASLNTGTARVHVEDCGQGVTSFLINGERVRISAAWHWWQGGPESWPQPLEWD